MDGVLVDNMDIHQEAFRLYCEGYGISDIRETINRCSGMGNSDIMRAIFPAEVIEAKGVEALAQEKEALYREIYAPTIEPIAGLVSFLQSLCDGGYKIAVGSSGCRLNVEFVLRACGIEKFFDALVYEELVTHCKPNPEIYLTAVSKLGLDAAECIVFEDAKAGIAAARAAGVARVVGVATTLAEDVLRTQTDVDDVIKDYTEATLDLVK